SLVQRDQASTGMDPWRAQRLWWHHNRQVLLESEGLPLQVVSYGHWFRPAAARQQLRQLQPQLNAAQIETALSCVRSEHRRSHRQPPSIPIAPSLRQLQRRLELLALTPAPQQQAARERLRHWLEQQAGPEALAPLPRRRSAIKRAVLTQLGRPPSNLASAHPWGYLAQIACGSEGPAADHQLHYWLQHGFSAEELQRFAALPGPSPSAEAWSAEGSAAIQLRGCDASFWAAHAWLQHCPLVQSGPLSLVPLGQTGCAPVALNLGPITPGPEGGRELLRLANLERVWDPDRQRVQQLRQFGIRASWLQPHTGACNPHLAGSEERWTACASELGLPDPESLRTLGSSLCLGRSSPLPNPPLLGLPGFDELRIHTPEQAHLLASWLQGCLEAGLELVRFNASPAEQALMAWQALWQPTHQGQAPLLLPREPMSAEELLQQLAWHRQGCPPHPPCHTPQPAVRVLWELPPRGGELPAVAVCVSLYNYGSRVLTALESVRQQQQAPAIELIVVDDASTDNGAAQVQAWMGQHGHHFERCELLQHECNGGLAAARNTAFSAAESPWCFVLDADNSIEPLALAHALTVAHSANARCAVVHSLIRVQAEASSHDARTLVCTTPWQQAQLRHGNSIDAMALVRRKAWQAVGGYTHIPGGWEDYDFWCCLIEAGWHGVLCPQVLATYT
ncbi:MAG: glycosyltransferase, partial [Cyanobacteria bacterium M_surface_9_m1_291]|nr:glycosyltransferase [Cyanobacteria bacterium M_surface_9_m1_291]